MIRQGLASIAAISLVFSCPASSEEQKPPNVLWQGLAWGMTPEDAAPVAESIDGVKKARVRKANRSNPERRLKISHNREKIAIAGMPFELAPTFKDNRLNQVWLISKNQCGDSIIETYKTISSALQTKYPAPIFGSEVMTRSEVLNAELAARRSEEPQTLSYGFSNERVVVLLSFRIQIEKPLPYPAYAGGLAVSLWRLSRTKFDQRKAECGGTGDKRMDVVLTYLSRAEYDSVQTQLIDEIEAEQADLIDQL